jgi:hypothetical protein
LSGEYRSKIGVKESIIKYQQRPHHFFILKKRLAVPKLFLEVSHFDAKNANRIINVSLLMLLRLV